MISPEQSKAEDDKLKELSYAALNNPQGEELLKFLDVLFIRRPVADPSQPIHFAYYREGQNDLVRKLNSAIIYHSNTMRGKNDRRSNK